MNGFNYQDLQINNLLQVLPLINTQAVLAASVFVFLVILLKQIHLISRITQETSILLELTPPATTEKTSYTTQQLFSVIHNLGKQRSIVDKLIGKKISFACEIVSTQNQGIRYLIRTTPNQVNNLRRSLLSYLPQVSVKVVNEYLPEKVINQKNFHSKIIEFNLSKHFAYPLLRQETLSEHDPVAYITGMMTKLSVGELISLQFVLSPKQIKESATLKTKILKGEDVFKYLDSIKFPIYLSFIFTPLKVLLNILTWSIATFMNDHNVQSSKSFHKINLDNKERFLNKFEVEATKLIESKIDQSLFETSIRLLIVVKESNELSERTKGFVSSLGTFSVPNGQSLKKKFNIPFQLFQKFLFFNFRKRLLSFVSNSCPTILSVSEISDLYHFPFARVTQTENIVKVHSKDLPAPLSLKQTPDLDVVFAKNNYGGTTTKIGLSKEERVRHMYVIGATGTGKSTLLLSMINQDLKNGKGVCVVDPHGDLAETTINCIPKERIDDFIYFNPYDIKHPIGINLLELTPDLEEDEALLEKEFIAESVISLFRKVFSDAWSAHPHRIEYILRNTIHTAFTLDCPTLFTIFDLLNNPIFQKRAIQRLQDENLKNFWKYEFGKAGDYQKVKMVAPVTARIGRFLFSPSAKRILEQEKSTINFDEILDQKKILICNLSKGNIGEDTSEVMGIMILNKIQLASLKRARRKQIERNVFYLYVDEFQNFATPSFVQMLSEARKYGLNLTMAEQSTSQQKDPKLVHIILANTGTIVSFRSANPKDEELLLPQFRPYIDYGEIANLPSFHFYMKTAAITPEEPFSGETVPVNIPVDEEKKEQFIQASRDHYAITYIPKQKNTKPLIEKPEEIRGFEPETAFKSGVPGG